MNLKSTEIEEMALHESKLKLDYLEFSWQENDPFPTVEVVEKCIVGKVNFRRHFFIEKVIRKAMLGEEFPTT